MRSIRQNRLELALLAFIALVCAGLSMLQYRWTGELSRAERVRLRLGLEDQMKRLAREFDEEVRDPCLALTPNTRESVEHGIAEAYRARYVAWASSHDRRLFGGMGVAVPEHGTLNLYGVDGQGRVARQEWPTTWESLRTTMTARVHGPGPPPAAPPDSTLIELPVFTESEGRRGWRETLGWMIFEVNESHVRSEILPRLMADHLNSEIFEASVDWAAGGRGVIFSTRGDHASVVRGADLQTGLFPIHVSGPPGRSRGRFPERPPPRWTLAVRHREGSLDAAVSRTRTRNLITSLVLIALLGGAAWALVRYTTRSRRLAEMQFRFAAGVSHDLRTPLTAIRGAAFNLADGVITDPTAIRNYAGMILRNAEELTSMVENVLAFSTTLHHAVQQRGETIAIGEVLNDAAAAVAQQAQRAGCRIELTVEPGLPALRGDPVALGHAFRNLILNGAQHAAEGQWIGVSASATPDGVAVRVCDRGAGIPKAERPRIFEPFYRGERTRASQAHGTGLGLSLVRETVARHGGTLTVDDAPEGGARFTVDLPATGKPA